MTGRIQLGIFALQQFSHKDEKKDRQEQDQAGIVMKGRAYAYMQ